MILKTKEGILFEIDDEDAERVSKYKWYINPQGYVTSTTPRIGSLHYFLIGPPPQGKECDHTYRDKLDCRKKHLRFITRAQNNYNQDTRKDNTLGIKVYIYDT